jgi:hypothetical protein
VLNLAASGMGDKVQKFGTLVQDTLGDRPFRTLYHGDIRPIIRGLDAFVAKDKIDHVMNLLDGIVGAQTPIGIVTLRDLTLDQILNGLGMKGYSNLNLPHHLSAFTDQTLLEDLQSLESFLGIYGSDTVYDLIAKKIDFNPILTDLQT